MPIFFNAITMLQDKLEWILDEVRPDCIVANMFFIWATDTASKFGILRLVFHGTRRLAFCPLCKGESETLQTRSLIEKFRLMMNPFWFLIKLRSQKCNCRSSNRTTVGAQTERVQTDFTRLQIRIMESELSGVIVNSFYKLETKYANCYRDVLKRRACHIGPVSLCNQEVKDKAQRVKEASIDKAQWDTSAAAKFGIPRLVFHWTSFFAICAMQNLRLYNPHREVSFNDEPLFVHDLPRQIKLTKMQLSEHEWNKAETDFARLRIRIRESKQSSYGVIVNSV